MVLPLIVAGLGAAARAGAPMAARAVAGTSASSAAKFGGKALAQGALMRTGGNMIDGPDGGGQQRGGGGGGIDIGSTANMAYTSIMQPGQFG